MLAALLLVAAACSNDAVVATIGDTEIPPASFDALHPEEAELSPDETARSVTLLVLHSIFLQEARGQFGIEADEEVVRRAFDARTASLRAAGNLEEELARLGETPARVRLESELDVVRDLTVEQLLLIEAAGFDVDAAYRDYVADTGVVCVRVIELADPSEYDSVADRLRAGEPFGDVAREVSTDPLVGGEEGAPRAGGELGCTSPGEHLPEFAAAILEAPVGEPFGPVASGGHHQLVVVYEREVPPLEEVRRDAALAAAATQGPEVFRQWAVEVLQGATVVIHPDYGTWGVLPETGGVPTVIPANREVP